MIWKTEECFTSIGRWDILIRSDSIADRRLHCLLLNLFKSQTMKNIQFTVYATNAFLLSLFFGSILFFSYIFSRSLFIAVIGFCYVLIVTATNVFLIIDELLQAFNNKENRKVHINSAILLCVNIPIALIYYFILVIFNF